MVTAEFMSECMPLSFLGPKSVSEVLLDMCDDVGFVRVTLFSVLSLLLSSACVGQLGTRYVVQAGLELVIEGLIVELVRLVLNLSILLCQPPE